MGQYILERKAKVIAEIQEIIQTGNLVLDDFCLYERKERGKIRKILCIPLYTRIVINAVMKVVQDRIKPSLILDTAQSIKGRGTLYLFLRILKARKEHPDLKWFYKCDIKKFYESIPQDKLIDLVNKKFREPNIRKFLITCITMLPSGISIGLRSSQEFGNLFLSLYLDHVIKDKLGCKYYWRYCDDIVVGAFSPQELTPYIKCIHECADNAGLRIKENEQVFNIKDRPLDFLGYKLYESGKILLRNHIKKRFARKWKTIKSKKRKVLLVGAFYGMAKHANAKNLFKKITGYSMAVKFSDLNIQLSNNFINGKRVFDCDTVRLGDIQNIPILIKDFESGIKTNRGTECYIVLFEDLTDNNKEKKFFTSGKDLQEALEIIREQNALPFETVIKVKTFAENKKKYYFT